MLDNKNRSDFKQTIEFIRENYSKVYFEYKNDDMYSVIDSILLDMDMKLFKNKSNQQNRVVQYWKFLDEEIDLKELINNIEKEGN